MLENFTLIPVFKQYIEIMILRSDNQCKCQPNTLSREENNWEFWCVLLVVQKGKWKKITK
jgi:hypothetical protein